MFSIHCRNNRALFASHEQGLVVFGAARAAPCIWSLWLLRLQRLVQECHALFRGRNTAAWKRAACVGPGRADGFVGAGNSSALVQSTTCWTCLPIIASISSIVRQRGVRSARRSPQLRACGGRSGSGMRSRNSSAARTRHVPPRGGRRSALAASSVGGSAGWAIAACCPEGAARSGPWAGRPR